MQRISFDKEEVQSVKQMTDEEFFKFLDCQVTRYCKMWNNEEVDRKYLTKNLAQFFYNSWSKKSWLIEMIHTNKNMAVRYAKKYFDKDEIRIVLEELVPRLNGFDRRNLMLVWTKLRIMKRWHSKMNEAYGESHYPTEHFGNWNYICGWFEEFLSYLVKFIDTAFWKNDIQRGMIHINALNMFSKFWVRLKEWLYQIRGLKLAVDEEFTVRKGKQAPKKPSVEEERDIGEIEEERYNRLIERAKEEGIIFSDDRDDTSSDERSIDEDEKHWEAIEAELSRDVDVGICIDFDRPIDAPSIWEEDVLEEELSNDIDFSQIDFDQPDDSPSIWDFID